MHIPFRHKIGGVPEPWSKNNILFLSVRDSCHSFVVATSRSERFLSDKNTRRDRIVLWSAPSLLICSGRCEPFPAPSSSSHINHSKRFQLVNVCSFCEGRKSSAYHCNLLSPNPLTNILGLRLFYCIQENLLVLLIPAVHIVLLCHMFIVLTAFK